MVVMTYAWFDVTRNAEECNANRGTRHIEPCICHNNHKTYTWNDVILAKRSMIRVLFFFSKVARQSVELAHPFI